MALFGLNTFGLLPSVSQGGNNNTIQKSTSLRDLFDQSTTGLVNVGDKQFNYSPQYQYSDDDITEVNYILGSSVGGSVGGVTSKKVVEQTSEPLLSNEKPLSFAPALIGGGSTTATGGGDASSGLPILPLVAVGGLAVIGVAFVNTKFGKKKK